MKTVFILIILQSLILTQGCNKKAKDSPGAKLYKEGIAFQDKSEIKKAIKLLTESCNYEYMWGCYSLGELYDEGKKVTKDLVKAKSYYEKSCKMGDKVSCVRLKQLNKKR
jgi:uncharacterized protein